MSTEENEEQVEVKSNDAAASAGKSTETPAAPTIDVAEPKISIEDFLKVDLRVGRILEVSPHPNADRLLRLQVDLGTERRQLIAGLAGHYSPEDLIGRQVVVVANLKPAKLRGELSEGMILAASDDSGVALLTPISPMAPGSQVR